MLRERERAVVRKGWPLLPVLDNREREPWYERGGPSRAVVRGRERKRESRGTKGVAPPTVFRERERAVVRKGWPLPPFLDEKLVPK